MDRRFEKLYKFEDSYKTQTKLRSFLLYLNTPEMIMLNHGTCLTGGFAVNDGKTFPGVDGFLSSWHSRNLKIFSNLMQLSESPKERVLLIIGAGHVSILRHAAQALPEVRLIEVAGYL